MLKIHTPCTYIQQAIEHLLQDHIGPPDNTVVVLDSSAFNSVSEMYYLAQLYRAQDKQCKLVVVLNDRFINASRKEMHCGIHIQDPVRIWSHVISRVALGMEDNENTLRCLAKFSGNVQLSARQATVMRLMAKGLRITDISRDMNVAAKTVYSYVAILKEIFHQPTINHLYKFLRQCYI